MRRLGPARLGSAIKYQTYFSRVLVFVHHLWIPAHSSVPCHLNLVAELLLLVLSSSLFLIGLVGLETRKHDEDGGLGAPW